MTPEDTVNQEIANWLNTRKGQLKITATTTTPGGRIVDWVPIESQSKFKIATPPANVRPSGSQEPKTPTRHVTLDEPAKGPAGHVPIWRPDISRIPKTAGLVNFLNKGRRAGRRKDTPTEPNPAGYFHATSALFTTTYGCSAWLNVWDPEIDIPSSPGDDHSISQFWLQYNQPPQLLQSLEAGLTVDQGLNGDFNNHIFSFYTTNNYGNGNPANNIGGYNALASGWVQVHPTIFPGIGINGSSVQGGQQLEIGLKYQLFQGNWWLGFSNDGAQPWVWLGYYPASLFNGLATNGTWLSFGGEVNSLLANPCSTEDQMGSGVHASASWAHAAYQRLLINQSDAAGTLVNYNGVAEVDVAAAACPNNMYTVQCFMNSGTGWGSYQYYGGPQNWAWSPQVELTDRATSTGPALALNGVLGMAWEGTGQNNIWVSVSRDNGTTWSPQQELTQVATRNAPALGVVGGKFVMAWRGLGQDNIWVATSSDGLSWSPQTELGDRSTSAGPSLACAGNVMVMAWKGSGQSNIWVATSTDGIHWSGQVELTDRASQDGPAVAAAPGKFAMAWRGLGQNNIWVATSADGIHWSPQQELLDRATSASPAITYSASLGVFYMAWRGLDQNNIWVSSSTDGLNWTPQFELQDRSTNSGPALSPVAKTLYMAWQGSGQNNIWTSILYV